MMNGIKVKRIALVLVLLVVMVVLSGCSGFNMELIDTTWKFDRAVVNLTPDRVIEGIVQSWTDFDGSDMIQVRIDDVIYLTHSSNVVLISE
jgi:hypothetical protein